MNFWLETNSSFHQREGKYLISPIHTEFKDNHPIYKILTELKKGDIVFHYSIYRNTSIQNAITSFSEVKEKFIIKQENDIYCDYDPPYRIVNLKNNHKLKNTINYENLEIHRRKIEIICDNYEKGRTPFNKNFRFKQLYFSRVPEKLVPIFELISDTKIISS